MRGKRGKEGDLERGKKGEGENEGEGEGRGIIRRQLIGESK